ncbi:glycosyltransferase family 4 protein [uncultured Prevotella sp.]|uniref:glycosyltransferase family 4 protein n=1 Tax=uncultured Prevotella sp. TaxID=159272 RepID=UPI0025D1F865|nr:glycosyltransferase family 4 protein [uncultured Prevotella sp.]
MEDKRYKIVYLTPALYMAGGVERVLTLKANYFAEHFGYDITIILTDGKDKPLFYPLSDKVKVINFDINFEELWTCSFLKKIFVYLKKQRQYKKRVKEELMRLRPDITISLLRREINFINDIKDGSRKIGELHINRANYRNFSEKDSNPIKALFSKFWMHSLVGHLRQLDHLVVLTEDDKKSWVELNNVEVIPDPLSFQPTRHSQQSEKRVLAVGRYSHEKGFDLLLQAWSKVEKSCIDWRLDVFGDGDRTPYEQLMSDLGIDRNRCTLHGRTENVEVEYVNSSLFVCSSRFEGFGLVMVESMACGLPVVSFDCPWGPRSIITNHEDGVLVESGNIDKLAEAMTKLIRDDNQRVSMSQSALRNVERFCIERIAQQWKQLFTSL